MTKARKLQILTLGVVLAAGALGLARSPAWRSRQGTQSNPAEPADAVYSMLDAARTGNVDAYLAAYVGSLKDTLRQDVLQSTPDGFARYLRDSHAALKGVAVSDPRQTSETEAALRVEYIYQDRNEVQTMYLARMGAAWKITRVDGEERIKTLIPYGTPVKLK